MRTRLGRIMPYAIAGALILLAFALGARTGMWKSESAQAGPLSLTSTQAQDPAAVPGGNCGGCSGSAQAGQAGQAGISGCTGGGCGSGTGKVDMEALKAGVVQTYAQATGESGFEVRIQDFGCHQEASILRDGQEVKRFSISGGRLYEIN